LAHLLVGSDGRIFGLVRSYADPALLYAVRVEGGVPHEPTVVAGHRWFREFDGAVRPVPEPALRAQRASAARRLLRMLGFSRREPERANEG
jgi:hypothetical protein